ncbi:MAG: PmoA family protein [Melioribacteraceae bacterium]|nr:PmoA family protein [Melioribacteraceae bacterium]
MSKIRFVLFLIFISFSSSINAQPDSKFKFVNNDSEKKIDILIEGKLFTSYLYNDEIPVLRKPVLYPIISASGDTITRGYPLAPRKGERIDHPHQIGLWFNYGDVNGLDFWNNSNAIPAEQADKMGTINHKDIIFEKVTDNKAELIVSSDWMDNDGEVLLEEVTHFIIREDGGSRTIDRITKLTAINDDVQFKDNKEGMMGLRVARQLELPTTQPIALTDSHGNKTEVAVLDNRNVTGNYLNSEGLEGNDAWGKRAKWVALSGNINSHDVSVVIFDNPQNVGFPTYWHARDYGLFAANPLGAKIFSEGKQELNYMLDAGDSVTFKYRILIQNRKADSKECDKRYEEFIGN